MREACIVHRALGFAVAVGMVASCGSSTKTIEAVPRPAGAAVRATVADGSRSWSLLEDGGCVLLEAEADRRRSMTHPDNAACPHTPFTSTLRVEGVDFTFTDRDRKVTPCRGDCPGAPPDVTMSSEVLWGIAGRRVASICVDAAAAPMIVRPGADGFVLAPLQHRPTGPNGGESISFMADGRLVGPEVLEQQASLERCRAAVAPGAAPPVPSDWPFRIEVPDALADDGRGLFVLTDTGYASEGATLQVLAQGSTIPLALHPDTTTVAIALETDGPRTVTTELALPSEVRDILQSGRCSFGRPTIVVGFDDDAVPDLSLDGGRC